MAENALAPRPRNALVSRGSDRLQALLKEAAASPQYGALVDYLSARRMMPPIELEGFDGGAFHRNSTFGDRLPRTGVVTVGYRSDPSTVVHELTHAADSQLDAQYYEVKEKAVRGKITPAEQQFVRAYEKLARTPVSFSNRQGALPRLDMVKRLGPGWAKKESDYRATNRELPAWGMGGTVTPNTDYPAPPHLDPTMATEFRILMDLARRAQPVIPGR